MSPTGPRPAAPSVVAVRCDAGPQGDHPAHVSLDEEFASVLSAARAGADWAWSRLYADLAPTVLGYLRSRGAPDAEDVLGETFLQVVRGLEGFDGDESGFRSWVFTIAHRRLVDDRRRRGRRPVHPAADDVLDGQLPPMAAGEDEALASLGTERVLALLDSLTEEQRAALALRFVGGLTLPEVAAVLGRTDNATKALQRRGLRSLRRHLGVDDG